MSRQQDPGGRLDAAIDRAVRQLVQVDPPAGLRRRVLAALTTAPPALSWWPRAAVAGAALAVLVLAVTFMRLTGPPPADTRIATQMAKPAAPLAVPAPGPDAHVPGPAPEAAPPARAQAPDPIVEELPPPPRMDAVFGTAPDRRVAAASTAATGSTAPEDSADVLPALAPIELAPIVIAPIEIQPVMLPPPIRQ